MATKPETADLIEFRFRCAVGDAGHFIALLTKAGVQQISHELITEVASFRQRTAHDMKAEDFLTAWIADHPTFRAKEAIKAFRADGRTDGSGYTALRMLADNGKLKKLGEGNYARTDVKHIAGPKDKNPKGETTQNKYAVPNPAYIMRLAKRRKDGIITSAQIKGFFEKDGRAKTSVGPALATLLDQKTMTRIGEGQYQITEMMPPKKNGNGSQLEGTTNHG
jgi:hypothetical protein